MEFNSGRYTDMHLAFLSRLHVVFFYIFRRVLRKIAKCDYSFVGSALPHGTIRLALDGFL